MYKVLLSVLLLPGLQPLHAYAQLDTAVVRQKVEARQYTFQAQTAMPLGRRSLQLSGQYDLRINGDSIIAALPYFGRAYSAPVNSSDNGISFAAVLSEYQIKARKKSWEITLKPKDVRNVNEMNLTIYNNGRASLRVNSNNRQSISFNGVLAP